jgi:polysaccharide pyruvyl transferase WcaK-like protein
MKIAILDPSYVSDTIRSPNLGDQVISRAITYQLKQIFPNADLVYFPTKSVLNKIQIEEIMKCDYRFVAGSNLLWFRWWKYSAWKINYNMIRKLDNLIFLGVGWGDYRFKPNAFGRYVCKNIISKNMIHSFRDEFTTNYAASGLLIKSCLNTICPTMWSLSKSHCNKITTKKSNKVLFTLTDYRKDRVNDEYLINTLLENYEEIHYFPQGSNDYEYFLSLNVNHKSIQSLEYSFNDFVKFVDNNTFDYVGTRLHAGIYCLEKFKRSIIIGVDNRALEINNTSNIPYISRDDISSLNDYLNSDFKINIDLPEDSINKWKEQFNDC